MSRCHYHTGQRAMKSDLLRLCDLPNLTSAVVVRVVAASPSVSELTVRRLEELGFIEGEPLQVRGRGPGGKEPLAVLVGDTLLALRWLEAQCVLVKLL